MKRLTLLSCLFLLLGQSEAAERSLQLAHHFPMNTQIYAESKISSLTTIDTFIQRWLWVFSGSESLVLSLEDGLAAAFPGNREPIMAANFLGNRVAIGIAEFEQATSTQLLALKIDDSESARQWLEEALAVELQNGSLRQNALPQGAVRYQPDSELLGTAYEIHDDVLLIASAVTAFRTAGEPTLRENSRLLSAFTELPALDYPAILLLEGEMLLLRALGEAMAQPAIANILPPLGRNWLTLIAALGDAAVGFRPIAGTQLFEVVLAIQSRPSPPGNLPTLEFPSDPQDVLRIDTASQFPYDTALLILGHNLGADVEQLLGTISAWAGWFASYNALPDELAWLTTLETLLPFALRTTAQLSWDLDLLEWMRGPYEIVLRDEPPEFSLKTLSASPAKTKAVFQQLKEALDFYDPSDDVFQPAIALPASWGNDTLELQLFMAGQWAHLRQLPANILSANPPVHPTLHQYGIHRLPGSQLFLFLAGEKLEDWAAAIDPSLANLKDLGELALSLQWQEPIFMIQFLFMKDGFAPPHTPR